MKSSLPIIWPVRTPAERLAVGTWQADAVLPMVPNQIVHRGGRMVGTAVHGYPFTYVRLEEGQVSLRDAAVVAATLENVCRLGGQNWSVTFVSENCPYAKAMGSLGYRAAAGKLYWKEL